MFFFFLAALCKETALVLPLILVAYDSVFRRPMLPEKGEAGHEGSVARHGVGGARKDHIKKYIPYFAVAGIYFIMRMSALGGFAPVNLHKDLNALRIVMNIFPLFSQYLEKLFLPAELNAYHVFHPVGSITETRTIASLLIAAFFSAAAYLSLRKDRTAFFGLLLIVIPLLPAFYIPGLGRNVFTERYLYLPSVGFCFLMAYLLARAAEKYPRASAGMTIGITAVLLLYSAGTVGRNAGLERRNRVIQGYRQEIS